MGQEILYCYKCQTRLLGSEFEKGKAFKVGAQASCKDCVKDLLGSVPEAAYETDRGRKLQSTTRIPAAATESGSGKWKPYANRTPAPSPAVPPKSKNGMLIGGGAAVLAVMILLGVVMGSGSNTRRNDPPSPTPPANPQPAPPPIVRPGDPPGTPAAPDFKAELRDIDQKLNAGFAAAEFTQAAALLDEARKRRNNPEWLNEIDLRIPLVERGVRRASIPLRDKAIDAQKAGRDAEVKSLREKVAAWGFPAVVEDFNRALAEAATPPPPPTPPPSTPPGGKENGTVSMVGPTASTLTPSMDRALEIYNDGLGYDVRDHTWSAKVERQCSDQFFEGGKSYSYTPERPWAGLYLHPVKGVDIREYPFVTFALRATVDKPQIVMYLWGDDKTASTGYDIEKLGPPLKANVWQKFIVPTAAFTPSRGRATGFILHTGSPKMETPLFYLDSVSFLHAAESKAAPVPPPTGGKFGAAALKAAARDYDGAIREADDAADVELLKLTAQVPVEAGKIIDKWAKGQKTKFEYLGPGGERVPVEGAVVAADAVRISLTREDGPLDVPVSELAASSIAEIFRSRADKKPTDARAAAAYCAFEGDVEGMKRQMADSAALPEKLTEFAAKRPAPSEAELAARRLFWAAESEFASPRRRSAAVEKYTALLAGSDAPRLRPYASARLEAAKDTIFIADDLAAAGTFGLAGSTKVEAYWTNNADTGTAKAKENFVEAEFPYIPGTTLRAWVWAGGCCQETFDGSWQATELSVPNPKNSAEKIACEPGGDAAPQLKVQTSLRKWHAQHGGPKEPQKWEWIPLTLPKYEAAGARKIRILSSQQGFSVAAIVVSATRREPPRDAEMKELEKARAVTRKAGGNEPPGNILHEWWWNIDGDNVSDLLKSPAFQGKPSATALRDLFEAPRDMGDRYGARMRGFVHAPVTGLYTFWIVTDDGGELFLSTDDTVLKKRSIATCPTAGGWRDWTRHPSCKSAPVQLVAGKRYYIEALQKEGGGSDHLSVGWTLPDGTEERPIPGKRLSPWATTATSFILAPAGTLYRAFSLNGPATVIDGRRWEGKGAADVSVPAGFENQNVPLVPPVDDAKAQMIRASVFDRNGSYVKVDKVPPGNYLVYLWIWEDNASQTVDLFVQGKEVMKAYSSGEAGHWDRLGPWPASVTTGLLEVRASAGDANFSGLEIWKAPR